MPEFERPGSLPFLRYATAVWRAVRWFRRVMIAENVVLLRLNNAPNMHRPALLAAWLMHVPAVACLRSFPRGARRRRRLLLNVPRAYLAVSEAVRTAYLQEGVPGHRITTLYDGTRLPAHPLPARANKLRVGMVSRLVRWKGVLDFVHAAAIVRGRYQNVEFVIAGEEDPAEPGVRADVARAITQHGLNATCRLVGFSNDVPALLSSLHCFVNPSRYPEPFGMSALEAMAHGVPVVATRTGGITEIVEDGRSGLLVPPGDPVALAEAITGVVGDPALAERLSAGGRARAAVAFDLERQAARQEAWLKDVLDGTPPQRPEAELGSPVPGGEIRL
jgi:glycosyltransferase involved in cell wall biosynthesis